MTAQEIRRAAVRETAAREWAKLVAQVEADGTPDPSRGVNLMRAYLRAVHDANRV